MKRYRDENNKKEPEARYSETANFFFAQEINAISVSHLIQLWRARHSLSVALSTSHFFASLIKMQIFLDNKLHYVPSNGYDSSRFSHFYKWRKILYTLYERYSVLLITPSDGTINICVTFSKVETVYYVTSAAVLLMFFFPKVILVTQNIN